jgi:hypothetical protein
MAMRILSIAALVPLAGCVLDDYAPEVGPPLAGSCDPSDSDPETDVSFALDLRPMMNSEDFGCGCHTPTNGTPSGIQLGGLNLGSYQSLRQGGRTSGSQIIVEGDPCSSVLIQKLSDTPGFGSRMPLDGEPYWSDEQLQMMHDWIAEGAQDN